MARTYRLGSLHETEGGFLQAVQELAQVLGWKVHHQRAGLNQRGRWSSAIQGDAGFP